MTDSYSEVSFSFVYVCKFAEQFKNFFNIVIRS